MWMQASSTKPFFCSRAGAHIYLLEDDPFPQFNGAILSIAQIIKFVMALVTESELVVLFITAQEMITHRQTLIAMDWPNKKVLSKWITLLQRELPTKLLSTTGPR
jgi:hypothetical protein